MLIEFRVENHRSLRDEQVLTMEAASNGNPADQRPRAVQGHDKRLLPAAAIYGANASGKSNVLSAFAFMREAIRSSLWFWEPADGVPREPFAWGPARSAPSTYEATFLIEGVKFQYGFVVSDAAIEEEWLYAWPSTQRQDWFERDGGRFTFGENLTGPNDTVKEVTRSNALFLTIAAKHNHAKLSPIYDWFFYFPILNVAGYEGQREAKQHMTARYFSEYWKNPPTDQFRFGNDAVERLRYRILELLRSADPTIVEVEVNPEKNGGASAIREQQIRLKHQTGDDESWLSLDQESQGLRTLFCNASSILDALRMGNLLIVDELESSLHPNLGQAIVELFNNPATNPNNAQLIFSTHDTNLLGNTLGDPPLRREQIWLTEKDSDGATQLYPLTDYKPRKVENMERGYLQGRYGAIPFLGDFARIVE